VQCGRHDTHLIGRRPCWRAAVVDFARLGGFGDVDQKKWSMLAISFFFSNRLLSFTLAVPRIRLRFQTLLFGSPGFFATLGGRADD
jgi:hypothetical protein